MSTLFEQDYINLLSNKKYKRSLSSEEKRGIIETSCLAMEQSVIQMDPGAGLYRRSEGRGIFIPLGRYITIFQAEMTGVSFTVKLALQN